ncbi:MBL fold metallo-hydrolase [Shewanella algae]|uniref:MBL fold metallo-hydrolase n=1 Tax=Shewanella algae TaxID=38313 RepID=UPI0026588EFC|nr:MBL fold metallo-hydrolase [Shewanella algae]WKC40418.1 MBL fold metallo-hydrolase [Shewanella algae]
MPCLRKRFTSLVLFTLVSLAAAAENNSYAENPYAKVKITTHELLSGRYMLTGAGGNIGVSAGEDGLLIIDDQFAPLAEKISAALQGLKPGHPAFVINTHFHGDHTGGNLYFGQNANILAHENVLKRLSEKEPQKKALPVITYDKGLKIHFNNQVLELIYLGPGHTDGDTLVLWQDRKLVHMGDLFFKDRFPFIDLDHGGSVIGYRDNVAAVLELIEQDTLVIPGHGELANKADLLRFKHMLDDCINWMKEGKQRGMTLEQMQATELPQAWREWGWQFIPKERWVKTLYQGLTEE